MITLTHQQAQELLHAGQEVTEPVRESLAQHLATCADCRAYAALVNELAQVVPALYPSDPLSEQAVRQKAAGKLPLVRRKSIMNRAITGSRAVVWAGIMLSLFLVAVILIPKMMVNETGGVAQTATGTPAPPIEIPAQSELFHSFIWDHQPELGYAMLRPTNWVSQERGTAARSYIPDTGPEKDDVTLIVTNYQLLVKNLPQNEIIVQWELFQDNPTLDGWTQALETSWERTNTQYQIEHETDRAKIYSLQMAPGGKGLVAYIVDQGQPFSVALDLRGAFADMDLIRKSGIYTDLATIVDSFNNETENSLSRSSTPLPPTSEATSLASPIGQPTTDAANTERIISPDGRFVAVYQPVPGLLRIEDVQSGQIQINSFSGVVSPGNWSPDSRYLLFWENKTGGASIQADGLTLWALDVGTGEAKLISTTLVNPEYQSWSPDGRKLAFTNGGYRSAQVEKWLSIFNVSTGQVRDLIPKETLVSGVVDWSPDGKWIAVAAVEGSKTGNDYADYMGWDNPAIAARRIYLVDPVTGGFHRLTQSEAYEDAPRWSEDGKQLFFVQAAGTQALLMTANPETGAIDALPGCEIPLPPSAGYYGQVDWSKIYSTCDGTMRAITPQPFPEDNPNQNISCTWEETPLETLSSYQDSNTGERWYTYTDAIHGFTFQFPAGWTMTQCDSRQPNFFQLRPSGITGEDIVLTIGVRLDSEDLYIMRMGVGSGDIVQQGTVQFFGQEATRDILIEEGKTKSVLYDLGKEITRGSLVVTLGLDHFEYRQDAHLSPEIQEAADQIVQSFALAQRSNATNEFELYFYRPLVVDYDPMVWEDRSEPDNKEMMVNSLQHRELASCTIGVRGASGFYPENMQDETVGDITYQVYEQEIASGSIVKDYFFKSAPTDAFDEVLNTIGIPILQVQYQPSEEQGCLAAAEEVIATLHPSERLINMPYCDKLAHDYRTPPNQKIYCDPDYNFAFNYPQDWGIEPLVEVRDTLVLQFVRRMKRFQNPDKSNFIRVDTYRLPAMSTLEETFKAHNFYPEREFSDHEYEELRIGGQRAYAFTKRLAQDYSAVYLFFQHGEYYTIMEIKAITAPKLDTNWKIARSIQVPGGTLDNNFFPEQLLIDSYQLAK